MKLGRYLTIAEIGRGGMGVVYRAQDPNISRDVAIKILDASKLTEPERSRRLERFTREAKVAGNLHHPSIVTIYDAAVDLQSQTPYIAMELVQGIDLATILNGTGALPARQVVSILFQVADALDYAHEEQVIHRDIKPANILLTERGDAKVLDFGIAKIASDTSLTQTGKMIGTPGYTSPEQIEGTTVDYSSDHYGLAVLAWELLSGHPPFQGKTGAAISYQILHMDPSDIENLPSAAMAVLRKGIARKPEERYEKATDFVTDLAATLDVPLPPRSPSGRIAAPLIEPRPARRRSTAPYLFAGTLLMAAIAFSVYVATGSRGTTRRTTPASDRPTRSALAPPQVIAFGRVKVNIRIEGAKSGRIIIEVDSRRHDPIPFSAGGKTRDKRKAPIARLSRWLRLKEGSRRFRILIEANGRTVKTNNLRLDLRADQKMDLNVKAVLSSPEATTTITVRPHRERKGGRTGGHGSPPPSRESAPRPLPRS